MNEYFTESHKLIYSMINNKYDLLDTTKSNFFFSSYSGGLSINNLLKLISPYTVSQLEIKTLLKPISNNFFLKYHISSDFEGFFFGLFYMHNLNLKKLYTFNL